MQEIIKYKSFNGRLFDTSEECITYEKYNDDKRLINELADEVWKVNKRIRYMNRYHNFQSPIKQHKPIARRNKQNKKTYYGNTVRFKMNSNCPEDKCDELINAIITELGVHCYHEYLSGGDYIRVYREE